MGIPYSCFGTDYDPLDDGIKAVAVRSISFKGEDVMTTIRTLSFNDRDLEPSILKSLGSEKMIIQGSLSFKGTKIDPFQVETTFSIMSPFLENTDSIRTSSFKSSDFDNSILEGESPKRAVYNTESSKHEAPLATLSMRTPSGETEDSIKTTSFKSLEFSDSQEVSPKACISDPDSPKHEAAVKLQKVYKSFRTRRQLADCAVLVEQSWWKLLDFALLKHSSISFFDVEKPESVLSRWSRAKQRAAKVGKGLLKDEKARKLALQHWLEAIDPRHRYGHNLHLYYVSWLQCESRQPFFYWLDVGDGKEVNLERCPRLKLQQQCIKYLGPKEREAYEVIVEDGKLIYKQSGQLIDTSEGNADSKWIFVLSTSKTLYVGQKRKGKFQHSSFLAGGATSSAGRLVVEKGILKAIWPHSGHYRPTKENFQEFVSFLNENNVDLRDVQESPTEDEESWSKSERTASFRSNSSRLFLSKDFTTSQTKDISNKQDVELRHPHPFDGKNSDVVPTELNDSSLELEGKRNSVSCSDDSTSQEMHSFDDFHVSPVQDMFGGFDGESDEDTDDRPDTTEPTETSDVSETLKKPTSSKSLPVAISEFNNVSKLPILDYMFHKRNLFEEKEDDNEEQSISRELILRRINSNKRSASLQLRKQLSFNWTTGAGPRISCVRDYPSELQFRALEQVNLSPRSAGNSKATASSSLESQTPKSTLKEIVS